MAAAQNYAYLFNETADDRQKRIDVYNSADKQKERYDNRFNNEANTVDAFTNPDFLDKKKSQITESFLNTLDNPNNVNDAMIYSLLSNGIEAGGKGYAINGGTSGTSIDNKYSSDLATYNLQKSTEQIKATGEANKVRDMQAQAQAANRSGVSAGGTPRSGAVTSTNNQVLQTNKLGNTSGMKTILGG